MLRMLAFGAASTPNNNMNLPMKPWALDRRAAVRWGACNAALSLLPAAVRAQSTWPNKAIRLVVPFAPGGSSEIVARATAAELGKLLGQSVYVENKPGAAGNVAMGEVARADDQHTLILGHIGTLAVNPFIFDKLPYNADTAFKPLSLLSKVPSLFVVHPDVPAKNLREFITLAKSKPGALNYGSAGNGSAGHLAFEYLKMVSGIFVLHVPYRGTGPQLTNLMGGRLDAAAVGAPAVMQFIKTGKLRCIATGTPRRLPQLPDVPTVAEQGYPGFEMTQWYGLLAPASMLQANADKLAVAAARAVKEPAAVNLLESEAALVVGSNSAEFAAFIEQEKRRWKPVIARAKIKPD
jgi:tripartite-type tricarboxylate transporter receptor subunit TctC